MRVYRFFPLLILLMDACIDPLTLKLPATDSHLVVDGFLSDDIGPYQIKLYRSSNLDDNLNKSTPETGAHVVIVDDLGTEFLLKENSSGVYETASNVKGELGRSYSLKITTKNGKGYYTTPQKLNSAGAIDSVYVQYQDNVLSGDGQAEARDVFNVNIDAHGVANESNLFRWRWTGIYETVSYPERHKTLIPMSRPPQYTPTPEPCSGYIATNGTLQRVGECICCSCWSTEQSTTAHVSDNRFVTDVTYSKVTIAKVPITNTRFYKKYYIEIEQLSISEEVHNFWKLLQAQQEANGSLFQPSSVKVIGNIKCSSDPDEQVFGVFAVSSSTKRHIYIGRDQVPYQLQSLDTIERDCRTSYPYSSNVRPSFW